MENKIHSIQEVFSGNFKNAKNILIQKCDPEIINTNSLKNNYSESWPNINEPFELFGMALKIEGSLKREIHVGTIKDIVPSKIYPGRFRFYVDHFTCIGIHDKNEISDADFYNNGGGGGSRVKIRNKQINKIKKPEGKIPYGSMEQRLLWVRKNHHLFRDKVWEYWDGECSVYQQECSGLLIASHIYPWHISNPKQKTDFNNGLLLSAPLDYLFDRGLISFSDSGTLLKNSKLDPKTAIIFGISNKTISIDNKKITSGMKKYLNLHRKHHNFTVK